MKPENIKEQELNEEQLDEVSGGLEKNPKPGDPVELPQEKKY
jgi:bacteriocin-like protein